MDIDFDSLKRREPDRTKLHELFSRLEFASLMQEYLPEAPAVEREYRVAGSADDIRDFAGANSDVAIWLEATTPDGFDELIAASISMRAAESLIVPISGDLGGMGEMSRELKRLLYQM